MANTLRFKRGLASGLPTGLAGEPLFTTDTFDLYIGNGTGNTRFQKYIASGATTQILRGDGSLYTFPLAISSPSNGQVLKYNGTSWVNDSDSGITGSLTTNYLPKATGATTLGNSLAYSSASQFGFLLGGQLAFYINGNYSFAVNGVDVPYFGLASGIETGGSGNASLMISGFDNIKFYQNTVERMRVSTLGNLLIGTFSSDSGEKLQVTGTMKVTGASSFGATATITSTQANTSNYNWLVFDNGAAGYGDWNFYKSGANNLALGYGTDGGATYTNAVTFAYGGAATFSNNLNVNGNLTVDGSILFVDATNDRVGIGTTTPSYRLHIAYNGYAFGLVNGGTVRTVQTFVNSGGTFDIGVEGSAGGSIFTGASAYASVLGSANATSLQFATNATVRATLDASGNLGLGVTPSAWGDSANGTRAIQFSGGSIGGYRTSNLNITQNAFFDGTNWIYNNTSTATLYQATAGQHRWYNAPSGTAGNAITFTQAMTLDASGNLGLGVTPSAWASFRAMQLGATANISGYAASTEGAFFQSNSFYNGGADIYQINGFATRYQQGAGQHRFFTAPSGTAGNAITFTQAMTLTANGRLLLGTTTEGTQLLQVAGTMSVTGTSTLNGAIIAQSNTPFITGQNISSTSSLAVGSNGGYLGLYGSTIITFNTGTSTERMRIDANGNVGIGTTSTTRLFQISSTDTSFSATSTGGDNACYGLIKTSTSGNLIYGINRNTGNTFGTGFLSNAAAIYIDNNNALQFGTNNNARVTIFGGGNVAIGSTTDSGEKLQVNGTMKVTGASTFNGDMTLSKSTLAQFNVTDTSNTSSTQSYIRASAGTTQSEMGSYGQTKTPYKIVGSGDMYLYKTPTAGDIAILNDQSTGSIKMAAGGSSTAHFTIASTGAATFSSTAQAAGFITSGGTGYAVINSASNTVTALRPTGGGSSIMSTNSNGLHIAVGTQAAGDLILASNNTERIRLSQNGFFSQLNATNPSASITDSYIQYSADVTAGNAAPHFRTENGAVIKLYQETTAVGNAIIGTGGGNAVLDDTTFDGYTLRQLVRALRNQGILQ